MLLNNKNIYNYTHIANNISILLIIFGFHLFLSCGLYFIMSYYEPDIIICINPYFIPSLIFMIVGFLIRTIIKQNFE